MSKVATWLFLCCVMVIAMVCIGGVTRLTKSGLSITEWRPITGILLPLSENQWLLEKQKYQTTPEYKSLNYNISIAEFKKIYLIEYTHRLLARLTGLVFFIPFVYFLLKKKLPKTSIIRLLIVLTLGFTQGFAGWYMVKSGLIDHPHVSHYRLAIHLTLTLIIFSLLWLQFTNYIINPRQRREVNISSMVLLVLILGLTFIQIVFGAFVAGLNAGLIYNTFPLMDISQGLFFIQPKWLNIFENNITVQFIHRSLAFVIITLTLLLTIKNKNIKLFYMLLLCLIMQITLGVIALLLRVPMTFALAHQVFAFILYAVNLYTFKYIKLK